MISIDALTAEWATLPLDAQLGHWTAFLDDLDAGAAGYHRYYPILLPLWDRGDVPAAIDEAQLAKYEAEMRAEAQWDLQHPSTADAWMDYCIRQLDPATADLDFTELPY